MTWQPRRRGGGFVPNDGDAEHRAARKRQALAGCKASVTRVMRARRVRESEPVDPRRELLDRARSGDVLAIANADALFGDSWRRP